MRRNSWKAALLASTFVAVSAPAFAADLPMAPPPAPPPAPAPAYVPTFTWTGLYLGVNGGYGWSEADFESAVAEIDEADGFLAGGTVGYNYQFGSIVVGAEADVAYWGLEAEDSELGLEANWFGTARARVGYAFDRMMVYATGGAAFSDMGYADPVDDDSEDTSVGWTVGGGVEGLITENVTAKLEYLYADFSDEDVFGEDKDVSTHVIRAGVNYKFSGF